MSTQIENLLKKNDKILSVVNYDVANFTPDVVMATDPSGNTMAAYGYVPATFIGEHCIGPTFNYIYNMYQIGNIPNLDSITERYILTTYDQNQTKMLGEVEWIANYITATSTGGVTDVTVQEFMVTANQGLYSQVTKVIIDFTDPVRKVYLIGNKC